MVIRGYWGLVGVRVCIAYKIYRGLLGVIGGYVLARGVIGGYWGLVGSAPGVLFYQESLLYSD